MEKNNKYSKEFKDKVRELYPYTCTYQLAKQLGIEYSKLKSLTSRMGLAKAENFRVKKIDSIWNEETEKFLIKHYPDKPNTKLAKQLNTTVRSILARANVLGLKKSQRYLDEKRPGKFKKGHATWNKGKSVYTGGEKGWFKQGSQPKNTLYDGAITVRRDSKGHRYKWIRIAKGKWEMLHRHLWEKEKGSVPDGCILVFKDGDPMNCKIDNFELINRRDLMKRNSGSVNLPDRMVAQCLATQSRKTDYELKDELLKYPELLELKRQSIILERAMKKS